MNNITLIQKNQKKNDNYLRVFDYCYSKFYNDLKRDELLLSTNKNIFSYCNVEYSVYLNEQEEMVQEIILSEELFAFILLSSND